MTAYVSVSEASFGALLTVFRNHFSHGRTSGFNSEVAPSKRPVRAVLGKLRRSVKLLRRAPQQNLAIFMVYSVFLLFVVDIDHNEM